uniref:Reverse transcriptase domain-containing protein n=1 Tax=Leptobrachium leishanense TaxID=445787 RepID=A0A8C5PBN3_9ANUR
MLARKLRALRKRNSIAKIQRSGDSPAVTPSEIAEEFAHYYSKLYDGTTAPSDGQKQQKIRSFLDQLPLRSLTRPQANALASPITTEEILPLLKELRTSKAPGPDGFSPLYYKKFRTQLAPLLANVYNGFLEGNTPPKELLAASIVVIPKEGKDPTTCTSYRPISLLNVDMKIYAKVLATRLSRHLPSLVHPDQVGFIPSRGAPDNIRRAVNLLSIAHASKQPSLLLSLDAEKAFDRVDWTYLWEVLRRFGVGDEMIRGIRALYTSPTASVTTMGGRSRPFDILNGTRQGCPLSPLLFALCLEPLAEQIRGHPDISGIAAGDKNYKLSLFADDILLTITRPLVS